MGEPLNHDSYSDDYLRGILDRVNTIAMVGASEHWNRPSYFAMKYLQDKGYRVIPVNPQAKGGKSSARRSTASRRQSRADRHGRHLPPRRSRAGPIVDDAIAKGAKVVWMQFGVRDDAAAAKAEAAGLAVVMNRCPKIEYSRLHGELAWSGVNTGIISSKRRKL